MTLSVRQLDFVVVKKKDRFRLHKSSILWELIKPCQQTATDTPDGQSRYELESPLQLRG